MSSYILCDRCCATGFLLICDDPNCHQGEMCRDDLHDADEIPCPDCNGSGSTPATRDPPPVTHAQP